MLKEKWLKDNEKWYYFNDYGHMVYSGAFLIDGKHYVFDNSGAMIEKKGWIYFKQYQYWIYFLIIINFIEMFL